MLVTGAIAAATLAACSNATGSPTSESGPDQPAQSQAQGVHTTPACQTFVGDVIVNSSADLAQFAGDDCFKIEGNLFIQDTTDITDLSALSGLVEVSRFIGIADNANLTDASLPGLLEVGLGFVVEGNDRLQTISADKLGFVGAYLHIFDNMALSQVSFGCLTQVVGDVIFAGDDALVDLDLAYLTKVGGRFIFEHSDGLVELCLPRLAVVGGDFAVHYNASIRTISAPLLADIGGHVNIVRNPNLAGMNVVALAHVGGQVRIAFNARLPQCHIDDAVSRILTIGDDDNDSDDDDGDDVDLSNNGAECVPMAMPSASCGDVCMMRPGADNDQINKATYLAVLRPIAPNVFGDSPSGVAIFTVTGDDFATEVKVDGVAPNMVHPQHIHGFLPVKNATCPTAADDTNGDGYVDVLEGAPDYGPILVPLDGNLPDVKTDAATFPMGASYDYTNHTSVSALKSALGVSDLQLEAKHVVVHGVPADADLPDTVQSLGGFPATVTLPVACGQIYRVN